jgi:hypothetical protein
MVSEELEVMVIGIEEISMTSIKFEVDERTYVRPLELVLDMIPVSPNPILQYCVERLVDPLK